MREYSHEEFVELVMSLTEEELLELEPKYKDLTDEILPNSGY